MCAGYLIWVKWHQSNGAYHALVQINYKEKQMKRWILVPVALVIALASSVASAAQGDWLGRARVININPDASSSALIVVALNVAGVRPVTRGIEAAGSVL